VGAGAGGDRAGGEHARELLDARGRGQGLDVGAHDLGVAALGHAEIGVGEGGDNLVDVAVEQDKFFGATRALVAKVGAGRLAIETASRDAVHRVRIPRGAIQFLDGNRKQQEA